MLSDRMPVADEETSRGALMSERVLRWCAWMVLILAPWHVLRGHGELLQRVRVAAGLVGCGAVVPWLALRAERSGHRVAWAALVWAVLLASLSATMWDRQWFPVPLNVAGGLATTLLGVWLVLIARTTEHATRARRAAALAGCAGVIAVGVAVIWAALRR